MANPLFGVVAAARLDTTPGASSRAAYYALVAQYQFGTPVIFGRAPAELAATIGVPLYSQIGDPGIQATVPGVVVVSFPNPVPSVVIGATPYPVDTAVAGGTIVGANYTDSNGVFHPDVDWQWQISVEAYTQGPSSGAWNQQVVTWVGDGTANRQIPTTFPTNVGRTAIWIFNHTLSDIASFRHNGAGMLGTSYVTQPADAAGGIMSFDPGGFTITNDGTTAVVNKLGQNYSAIVLNDTTADNRYMTVGDYPTWNASLNVINQFQFGTTTVLGNSGAGLTNIGAENLLQPVFLGSGTGIVAAVIDPQHWVYSGNPIPAPTSGSPLANLTVTANPPATRNIPSGGLNQLTMVWVFNRGRRCPFKTSEMPSNQSGVLGFTFTPPATNNITNLGVGQFTIGTDDASSGSNQGHYYFVAFSIPGGSAVRQLFNTFSVGGTGSSSVPVNVGFQPGFVGCRGLAGGTDNSCWRDPWHTTTHSTQFDQTDLPTDGITSFTSTGFTVGTVAAPNGQTTYGFALKTSGSVVSAGAFSPGVAPSSPTGGRPANGIPSGAAGGAACELGTRATPAVTL